MVTARRPKDGAGALVAVRRRIVTCKRCPELRSYCAFVARTKKREYAGDRYWGKPVPSIGPHDARVFIMGLAPAAHGGNRTGRMFTGDGSATFLARALYRAGFASQPTSIHRDDGFTLVDAFMSAALRCAPPGNKPTPQQLERCAAHLRDELDVLTSMQIVVALGKIAFDNILRHLLRRGWRASEQLRFAHGAQYRLIDNHGNNLLVLCSYHPSRQNTNTGKLTQSMLDSIFLRARRMLRKRAL